VFLTSLRLKNTSVIRVIKENFILSILWAVGLGGTVLIKQLLSYIVLGNLEGMEELSFRMGDYLTIGGRFFSVEYLFEKELIDQPVMIVLIVALVCITFFIGINQVEHKYNIMPYLVIALYPFAWLFVMAGHNSVGFVVLNFGVMFYAIFSCIVLNMVEMDIKCSWSKTKVWIKREFGIASNLIQNAIIIIVVLIAAIVLKNAIFHCETTKAEPWSTSVAETINLNETDVTQQIKFTEINGRAYLKNIKTVFINLPTNDYSGKVRVEIVDDENGDILKSVDVSLARAEAGEWFEIPIGCVVYANRTYDLTFSLVDAQNFEPYIFTEEYSQITPCEEQLYLNGVENENGILLQFEYDRIISNKLKLYLVIVLLLGLVIGKSYYNSKAIKKDS
jgi:hypothetical protein